MATQTAEYYASFDEPTPYFSKPVGSSVQPPAPTAPEEGQQFVKFVPSEYGLWNDITNASISYQVPDGSDSDSEPDVETIDLNRDENGRVCNAETEWMLQDSWSSAPPPQGDGSPSAEIVFYDCMTFKATLTIDDEVYTGSGAVENGDTEITLAASDGSGSISVTVSLAAGATSSSTPLKYYAVYKADPASYCTITFKWYQADGALHQESEQVKKGDSIAIPNGLPVVSGWTGAWYNGDTQETPTIATEDATYEYVLIPNDDAFSLSIDWSLDGSLGSVSGFKWGHPFPALTDPPGPPTGYLLQGLYLIDGTGDTSPRCYNTQGDPCARVTVNITQGDYSLKAKWMPVTALVSDLASLRSAVGIVPEPFASVPSAKCDFDMEASDTDVNFRTGFPAVFAEPLPNGKVITRQMVNALGNLGSQEQFFAQCGGYHTFDTAFAAAVGGYPENAILHFVDASGAFRTVRSLKNKNLVNFLEVGVDGINWTYADDNPTVSIDVDYSDYEDISERIFTETGVPDLYEVPFDSYLQAFAVSSLDCESLRRAEWENQKFPAWENGDPSQVYTLEVNGMYYSLGKGTSYLDIYHKDSKSFGSVVIGGFFPFEVLYLNNALNFYHASKICPLSPFSCGVFLSAGDRIRVRNSVAEKHVVTGTEPTYTQPMVHTDETLRRKYNYRFAALYRRGVAL